MRMCDKTYNVLKWMAQLLLPAMGTLYFALASIWRLPYGEQVVGTITAVDTFLGVILGITTAQYKQKQKTDAAENKLTLEQTQMVKEKPQKFAVVSADAANIREKPDISSPRVAMVFEGEMVKIVDETIGVDGGKWYKFYLNGDRDVWISEKVIRLK